MKILKDQKGSITLFVLISMLFFTMFLIGMYMLSANTESTQTAETVRIKEIYEQGIDNIDDIYETLIGNKPKGVNPPKLGGGMIPVQWNGTEFVDVITHQESTTHVQTGNNNIMHTYYDHDWYDYVDTVTEGPVSSSRWANARTKDGSMWVWIPRFAYKITYYTSSDKTTVSNTKTQYGDIDVVFLKDTTNKDFNGYDVTSSSYVNGKGQTGAYIVHPAFQDGNGNGFANGEWDAEITGFWMAKFEAGYDGEANNPASATDSNVKYSTVRSLIYYGNRTEGLTNIKYPVFKGNRPSMNYISIADAYDLCRDIQNGNVYGLSNVDSHLTKNSEWGAVAYLTYSKYGRNGENVRINNVSVNGTNTIYAVTGYAASTDNIAEDTSRDLTTLMKNNQTRSWTTEEGQLASSTGNVYGIYDLSGGLWEYTAGYIAPTEGNYINYGGNLKGESNKYKSKYEGTSSTDTDNYNETANQTRIGEAIWETSTSGHGNNGWDRSRSNFLNSSSPFTMRGVRWANGTNAGVFAFSYLTGVSAYQVGFRPVLIAE